jgi:hypothetical protein
MNRTLRSSASLALLATLALLPTIIPASAQTADATQTTVAQPLAGVTTDTDPFLWLEDVHGDRATAWVKSENTKTLGVLEKDPHYAGLYNDAVSIVTAKGVSVGHQWRSLQLPARYNTRARHRAQDERSELCDGVPAVDDSARSRCDFHSGKGQLGLGGRTAYSRLRHVV